MSWTASMLLETWDRGDGQRPAARTFALLAADGAATPEAIWSAGLAETNLLLLDVSQSALGVSTFHATADCPACGARLDTSFGIDEIRRWLSPGVRKVKTHSIEVADYAVTARDLTVADLAVAGRASGVASARAVLFRRSILSVDKSGTPIAVDSLPDDVLLAVSNHLGERDPAGDPRVGLSCSECGGAFDQGLDLTSHAWVALETAAMRLQMDVVTLARGLGWNESEVLALSPRRRASYLKLLESVG